MDTPVTVRLGEELLALGWPIQYGEDHNQSLFDGGFGIESDRLEYHLVKKEGWGSKKAAGCVHVAMDHSRLFMKVYGRDNGPELEALATTLRRRLGVPCEVTLERA